MRRKEHADSYAARRRNALAVGDEITVTVLGVEQQVRVGVNAPRDVAVHREEIYQRIQGEDELPAVAPTAGGQGEG